MRFVTLFLSRLKPRPTKPRVKPGKTIGDHMKHSVSKLLLFSFVAGIGFATTKTFEVLGSTQQMAFAAMMNPKDEAVEIIENYTGEKYHQGGCENTDLYESDDASVVQACNVLEGN